MPELPEVETTCRGIAPHVQGRHIKQLIVRERRLRWPVPAGLEDVLPGQVVQQVSRRAKYLLLTLDQGTLIIHLGMSGHLRVLPADAPIKAHDHVDLVLDSGDCLRLNDPRRFGSVLWTQDPASHPLLRDLGPEPLAADFDGAYLHLSARRRSLAVKSFIMDAHVVVGVGNIYVSEALFRAGIDPRRAAGRISLARYVRLAEQIRAVLSEAIAAGGSTLRDFSDPQGKPGYFVQSLRVYGRVGQPCRVCGQSIRQLRQGQRSSYYCPHCQS